MPKWLCAILTLLLFIPPLVAQEVEWSVDASMLINNREGGDKYTPDGTILFTRLAPELGVSMQDGEHELKGGVVWYQPMIDDMTGYKVLPTLYYRYNHRSGLHVTAGLMPRSLMVERLAQLCATQHARRHGSTHQAHGLFRNGHRLAPDADRASA